MRKLATAIILATSGIIATSAMAAPHDNHDRSPQKVVHQDKNKTGVQARLYLNSIIRHVTKLIIATTNAFTSQAQVSTGLKPTVIMS